MKLNEVFPRSANPANSEVFLLRFELFITYHIQNLSLSQLLLFQSERKETQRRGQRQMK